MPPTKSARRKLARKMIIRLYAGLPAQRLVDPNPAEYHGESDDEEAFELSKRWGVFHRGMSHAGDDVHQAYFDRRRGEARSRRRTRTGSSSPGEGDGTRRRKWRQTVLIQVV